MELSKKTQFQINILQSKLDEYNKTLLGLTETRENYKNKLDIDYPDYNKITNLQDTYSDLESQIKSLKLNISNIMNTITINTQLYKQQTIIYETHTLEEETILKDELSRIDSMYIEINEIYNKSIIDATNNKTILLEDKSLIENKLLEQKNTIKYLQLDAHIARKTVLSQLHQKKHDNLQIQTEMTNNNNSETIFIEQINNINTYQDNLAQLKFNLIDDNYKESLPCIDTISLELLYNIDSTLPLTEKLVIIDRYIKDNQSRLQLLNVRFTKHKTNNNVNINTIVSNYNNIQRIPTITFKDNLKIEKEKFKSLEYVLEDINNKYSTYEDIIIGNIVSILQKSKSDIEDERCKAIERITIMRERIRNDYNMNKDRLHHTITENKITLKDLQLSLYKKNEDIIIIKELLIKENVIGNQIDKINEQIEININKIKQTENDIIRLKG